MAQETTVPDVKSAALERVDTPVFDAVWSTHFMPAHAAEQKTILITGIVPDPPRPSFMSRAAAALKLAYANPVEPVTHRSGWAS